MKKNNKGLVKKIASIAAALVIVAGAAGFGYNYYKNANSIASTVSFDVNPSIELTLNKDAKVINATALNLDAEKVLGGLELKGTDANTATNAIIGSLLKNGYIDELANSILISVEDKDNERGAKLQQELTAQVTKALDNASASAAILAQHSSGEGLEEIAEKHHISTGKAALINRITQANPTYSADELAKLNVNELNLILSNPKNEVKEVATSGKASEKEYVGIEKAKAAAFKYAGVTEADVYDLEVDFDYENGKMVYEVDFDVRGKGEYEIYIDAHTGAFLFAKGEPTNNHQPEQTTAGDSNKPTQAPANDIGKEKAKQIALTKAGVKEADVTDLKVLTDYDDGRLEYNVKFIKGNKAYEYEVDAQTGRITDFDIDSKYEHDDDDDEHNLPVAGTTVAGAQDIGAAKAKQIALSNAGIAESDARRLEVEREYDDGRLEYSVEFYYNGMEYSYEINGTTGAIIEKEIERD